MRQQPVSHDSENCKVPAWAGNGRIVYDRTGGPAIWTMDIDGGNPAMVLKTDSEPYPALSPDGKWIAFTATGAGYWPTLRRDASQGGSAVEVNDDLWLQHAM